MMMMMLRKSALRAVVGQRAVVADRQHVEMSGCAFSIVEQQHGMRLLVTASVSGPPGQNT